MCLGVRERVAVVMRVCVWEREREREESVRLSVTFRLCFGIKVSDLIRYQTWISSVSSFLVKNILLFKAKLPHAIDMFVCWIAHYVF